MPGGRRAACLPKKIEGGHSTIRPLLQANKSRDLRAMHEASLLTMAFSQQSKASRPLQDQEQRLRGLSLQLIPTLDCRFRGIAVTEHLVTFGALPVGIVFAGWLSLRAFAKSPPDFSDGEKGVFGLRLIGITLSAVLGAFFVLEKTMGLSQASRLTPLLAAYAAALIISPRGMFGRKSNKALQVAALNSLNSAELQGLCSQGSVAAQCAHAAARSPGKGRPTSAES